MLNAAIRVTVRCLRSDQRVAGIIRYRFQDIDVDRRIARWREEELVEVRFADVEVFHLTHVHTRHGKVDEKIIDPSSLALNLLASTALFEVPLTIRVQRRRHDDETTLTKNHVWMRQQTDT